MRIRIEAKELKTLLEKVLPQMPKKSQFPTLECVKLVSKGGTLSATTTDLESYLTVMTNKYDSMVDGSILIHKDDIKLINKLSGELEINLLSEREIIVKAEKKSITAYAYDLEGFPTMAEPTEIIPLFTIQESQFTTTINKLINFVSDNENNKIMNCYNVNMKHNRIEALDGHRIGIIDITPEKFADSKTILLHSKINNDLKKVLDNKSMEYLRFAECNDTNKYYSIIGKGFIYKQRQVVGEYYKVDQMLNTDYDFKMIVSNKELLDIAKFNSDMVDKDSRRPMILHYNNAEKEHNIYMDNGKNKTVDKLEVLESKMMNDNFIIGFNPKFIYEALKCIDDEKVIITGNTPKTPILMSGENERYLILPVNLFPEQIEQVEQIIRDAT